MKIGSVVRKYGIPVNSLYFYINNGLLVPPRRNNQYVFDQRVLDDLEWILELKAMEFPLKTIHRLLSLRRISNLCSEEDQAELRAIYAAQDEALQSKEAALAAARQKLHASLSAAGELPARTPRTGVPVSMLRLLCCPRCGEELMMDNVSMSATYISRAELHCSCGYTARIRDGILQTEHVNQSPWDKPDTTRELYRDLPSMTLSLFERSYHWLEDRLKEQDGRRLVWFESYVTAWFFLHNHLELLRPDDSLIVVDKFPETLLAYKEVIERQGAPCDILYIADDSPAPPIRHGIIDRVIDFFGTNEHSFWYENFYLSQMLPYFKEDCELMGVYFFFKNGANSLQKYLADYPGSSSCNFNIHWFLTELERDFILKETEDCGSSLDSGSNLGLGFHVPGEELHLQPYRARRKPAAAPAHPAG